MGVQLVNGQLVDTGNSCQSSTCPVEQVRQHTSVSQCQSLSMPAGQYGQVMHGQGYQQTSATPVDQYGQAIPGYQCNGAVVMGPPCHQTNGHVGQTFNQQSFPPQVGQLDSDGALITSVGTPTQNSIVQNSGTIIGNGQPQVGQYDSDGHLITSVGSVQHGSSQSLSTKKDVAGINELKKDFNGVVKNNTTFEHKEFGANNKVINTTVVAANKIVLSTTVDQAKNIRLSLHGKNGFEGHNFANISMNKNEIGRVTGATGPDYSVKLDFKTDPISGQETGEVTIEISLAKGLLDKAEIHLGDKSYSVAPDNLNSTAKSKSNGVGRTPQGFTPTAAPKPLGGSDKGNTVSTKNAFSAQIPSSKTRSLGQKNTVSTDNANKAQVPKATQGSSSVSTDNAFNAEIPGSSQGSSSVSTDNANKAQIPEAAQSNSNAVSTDNAFNAEIPESGQGRSSVSTDSASKAQIPIPRSGQDSSSVSTDNANKAQIPSSSKDNAVSTDNAFNAKINIENASSELIDNLKNRVLQNNGFKRSLSTDPALGTFYHNGPIVAEFTMGKDQVPVANLRAPFESHLDASKENRGAIPLSQLGDLGDLAKKALEALPNQKPPLEDRLPKSFEEVNKYQKGFFTFTSWSGGEKQVTVLSKAAKIPYGLGQTLYAAERKATEMGNEGSLAAGQELNVYHHDLNSKTENAKGWVSTDARVIYLSKGTYKVYDLARMVDSAREEKVKGLNSFWTSSDTSLSSVFQKGQYKPTVLDANKVTWDAQEEVFKQNKENKS